MKIMNESDLVFIKRGSVYLICKDRYNLLSKFFAIDEPSIKRVLADKSLKVSIVNDKGRLIKSNHSNKGSQSYDYDMVRSLLEEAQESYESKVKAIDEALANRNKEEFMKLTDELYGGTANVH